MLSLRSPSAKSICRFLATQVKLPFTYSAVGATAETPPAGFVVDRTRIKVGICESVFRSAIAALQRWEQFQLGWVEAWSPDTLIKSGEVVAVMGRAIGLWWLNSCRIIYVVNESVVNGFPLAPGRLYLHPQLGSRYWNIRRTRSM